MNDQYLNFIREHGVDLEKALGVKEWALSRNDALTAIGILRDGHEAVLGGDVIFEREGRLRYTHDNWHSDPGENEPTAQYIERSLAEAEGYIRKYPETNEGKYYYVIVSGI